MLRTEIGEVIITKRVPGGLTEGADGRARGRGRGRGKGSKVAILGWFTHTLLKGLGRIGWNCTNRSGKTQKKVGTGHLVVTHSKINIFN
jgi:hypothetical protein